MISDFHGVSSKSDLRKELRARLKVFTGDVDAKASAEKRVVGAVQSLISGSMVVAGFHSMSDEPNLTSLYTSSNSLFVFPKLVSSSEIQFVRVPQYEVCEWEMSVLGFKQPVSDDVVPAEQIGAVIVPGLGFSAFGERLGRGKGFYDRYLTLYRGLKIGVCFDCQWVEGPLPTESWDIKMNYIITESKSVEIEE